MNLAPGQQLLHYRLIEKLGEGGMGVVWKAVDTTLDREVAIKSLPAALANDAERLARFEREAKLLASLNHTNIAAVHALHQAEDGSYFLSMELVPGEDLAARLEHGPVPLDEALEIARQVALALEAAHGNGVVHRDLKPANILLTPEGQVKVLDFGLAKALEPSGASHDASLSPTLTSAGTRAGVILGTAAYMSPEQARGKTVDRRADVWAFGCVLYEILTGSAAFGGGTVSDTLASILKESPDFERLPTGVPRAVRRLLERCLRKDPHDRLHDAADARIMLEEAIRGPEEEEPADAPRSRSWLPWVVAALMAAIAIWLALNQGSPTARREAPAGRFEIQLPSDAAVRVDDNPSIAVSDDGEWIVYAGGDRIRLYLRRTGSFEITPIEGSEGASGPFFSPDGEWIGFFEDRGGKLNKIPRSGGAVVELTDVPVGSRGADWGTDGTIVFPLGIAGGLHTVSEKGGSATPLIVPKWENGEKSYRHPHFLPGGRDLLATRSNSELRTYDDAEIVLVPLGGGEAEVILQGGSHPHYLDGHILYARAGSLMAVPFDLDGHSVSGVPFEVVSDMVTSHLYGTGQYAVSSTGMLVYTPGGPELYNRELVWLEPGSDALERLPVEPDLYYDAAFSPDGSRLAITVMGGNDLVAIHDMRRGTTSRLTRGGWDNGGPLWTPDGKYLLFQSNMSGTDRIYRQPTDGSGAAQQLLGSDEELLPGSFSPDGKLLAYEATNRAERGDVLVVAIDADGTPGEPVRFTETPYSEVYPRISPDGKWIAYASDETDSREVYVQPFPDGGAKWQISTNGGGLPLWSPDASTIYYLSIDGVMAVDVTTGSGFVAEPPRVIHPAGEPRILTWTLGPEGERFLCTVPLYERGVDRLRVVLNLFGELRDGRLEG